MDDLISKADVCEILADMYPTDGEAVISCKKIDKAYEKVRNLPTVPAVPLDKLCEWLGALCDTPCMIAEGICERNCQGYKPSDAECWKTVITKWMEG